MQRTLLTCIHLASLLLSEKLVKYPPFLSTILIFVEIWRDENTKFLQKYTHIIVKVNEITALLK